MKILKPILHSLALAALCSLNLTYAVPQAAGAAASGAVASRMQGFIDSGTTAGVVLAAANGREILSTTPVGWANIEQQIPMREDSVFWVASITKAITSAAIMMLVDEGKISLDDSIADYLPQFAAPQRIVSSAAEKLNVANQSNPSGGQGADTVAEREIFRSGPITIRQLLSNTSGLRFGLGEPTIDAYSLEEFVERAAKSNLLFEPGTDYSYSTLAFTVAGRIIEVVTNGSYEDFLQQRIFDPLGMADSTFWPDREQIARIAETYYGNPTAGTLRQQKVRRLSYPLDDRQRRHPGPGGGLFSTAGDIAKFGQLILNRGVGADGQRLLSEDAVAQMTTRQTAVGRTKYGLGISWRGDGSFGHAGALFTNLIIYEKEGLVVVFMVQKSGGWGAPDGEKIQQTFIDLAHELYRQ